MLSFVTCVGGIAVDVDDNAADDADDDATSPPLSTSAIVSGVCDALLLPAALRASTPPSTSSSECR
jgi:hypothetical protein